MKKMKNSLIVLLCLIVGVGKVNNIKAQTVIQLPYTVPNDTNSSDYDIKYTFTDVPGEFTYDFAAGGTHNAFCKSRLQIQQSVDGSTWIDIKNIQNSFGIKEIVTLKKETRYVRVYFDKCWSNNQWAQFKAGSKIGKSITTNTSSLDFGNVVLGDYTEKSVTVTWAANISGTSLTLNSDNPDFTFYNTSGLPITKIPVTSGAAGSASIKIRYTPTAIGNLSANIQVRDASYTQNAAKLSVAGKGTLAVPTNLTVGPMSYTSVPLSWSSVSSADGYWLAVINKSTNLAAFDCHIGDVTSKDLGDILDHGVTYLWKVRSGKDGVYSDYSTTQEFTTPNMIPVPAAATNLTETSLTANWNEVPAFGGVSISDYEITLYKNSDNSIIKTERTTALSHTFTGLTRGTNYEYTVSAYVTGGVVSQPSSRVNVMTAVYLPIAVTKASDLDDVYILSKDSGVQWLNNGIGFPASGFSESFYEIVFHFTDIPQLLTFTTSQYSGTNSPANKHDLWVYESTDGTTWGTEIFHTNNASDANQNLKNSSRYIKIRQRMAGSNNARWSLQNLTINPVTITALPATDVLANSFTANWQSVTGATDYAVSVYQKDSEGNTTIIADWDKKLVGSVSSVNVSELGAYQTYYYQVNAVFPGGQTQPSNEIEMTPMAIPFRTTAVELNNISLAWDDVNADAYDLLVTTGSEVVYNVTVPGTQTQYNVENLLTGTPYTISIKAQFGSQQSRPTEITVTTKSPQDLPQPVTIDTPPTIAETLRHNMTLSSVTLSGGLATDDGHSVEGSFRFKDPTMVLQRGEGVALVVVFDPVNTEYLLPTEFSIEVTVLKGLQTIVWSDKESLSELKVDDSMMKLTATATSGLAVNYQSSNTDIAEIVDGYLVIKSAGNVTLTVEQQGNDDFEAAESISQSIVVKSVNNGGGGDDNDNDNDSTTSVGKPLHLNLYPNPVNSTLFISGIDIESVELLTIQGQRLLLQQFGQPKSETTVDITMLPAGIYFVKIFSESQTAVRTITVRR